MKKRSKTTSSYSATGSEDNSGTSHHGLYQSSVSRNSTYTDRSNYTAGSVQSHRKNKSFPRSLTVVFSSCFIPKSGGNTKGDDDYDDDAMVEESDASFSSSKFKFFLFFVVSGIMLHVVVIGMYGE